jgi:predicted ATPase
MDHHPKVQTRLAHWFVALAMARRQFLVETHSDHLVRRLRGLAARAKLATSASGSA